MSTATLENPNVGRKRTQDRHAVNWPVRIPIEVADVLDALGKRNATNAATEARRLIREGLEREGLWPPKPAEKPAKKKHE